MKISEQVLEAMDTRPRGTWWEKPEIQTTIGNLHTEQEPPSLAVVLAGLAFLAGQGEVEVRTVPVEGSDQPINQYSLAAGGSGIPVPQSVPILPLTPRIAPI